MIGFRVAFGRQAANDLRWIAQHNVAFKAVFFEGGDGGADGKKGAPPIAEAPL
jgi:hypothetical protein